MNFDQYKNTIQCTLEGHEEMGVFGFCLNKGCLKKVCFKCLINLHNEHVADCIHFDYFEIILQNQISIFEQLCSQYSQEGSEFQFFLQFIRQLLNRLKKALALLNNQQFQDELLRDMLFCQSSASTLKQFVIGSNAIQANRKKNLINVIEQIYLKHQVDVEELTNKGDALKEQFYYQEALQCYQKAIDLNPSKITLFLNQGFCLHMLDQFYSALECFDLVLGVEPENTEAQRMIILVQESQRDPDINLELIQFVPFNDQEKQLQLQLFQILQEQSSNKKDTFFKQQFLIHEKNYRILTLLSCVLMITLNFEQSLRFSEKALNIYPHYNKALFIKAMCLIQLTRYDEAMNIISKYQSKFGEKNMQFFKDSLPKHYQFEQQIGEPSEQTTQFPPAQYIQIIERGGLLMRAGKVTEAIQMFIEAEKIQPNTVIVQQSIGECLFFLQRYEEAIVRYQEVIKIQINNQNAWFKIGDALFKQGKLDDALEICETFLAMSPKNFQMLTLQRQILTKKGGKNEILQESEIDLSSNDIVFLINLARSLTQQENFSGALKVIRRLAELQPNKIEFKTIQAYYQISLRDYPTALDTIENFILKVNPKDLDGLYKKGVALFNMKQYQEALQTFEIVQASCPSYLELDLCLGHCYFKQKRYDEAQIQYFKIFCNPPIMKRKSHYSYFCAKSLYFTEGAMEALEFYNSSILIANKEEIKEPMAVIFLMYLLRNVGRFQSVLNHIENIFTQSCVFQKYFSILYFLKSEILLKFNKAEEAFSYIDKITNFSSSWIVEALKENCLIRLNKQDQAQIYFNNAKLGKTWTSQQYENALLEEIENQEEHLRCWPSSVGLVSRLFPQQADQNGYTDFKGMYFVYDKI